MSSDELLNRQVCAQFEKVVVFRKLLSMQVMAFVRKMQSSKPAHVRLHSADAVDDSIATCLAAMVAACHAAAARKAPAAAPSESLLQILQLMLHTDAADVAAGVVMDMRNVVNELFNAQVPEVVAAGDGATDAAGDASMSSGDEDAADGEAEGAVGWVNQLTECLLAMLADSQGSVPVSVVRGAVEGVWRGVAPHVNALALTDLLAVVLRIDRKVASSDLFEGGGEGAGGGADEEGGSDESEDGASGDEGATDSSDGSASEGDAEGEGAGVDAMVQVHARNACGR